MARSSPASSSRANKAKGRESASARRQRAREIERRLESLYPDAECALVYSNPLELLIATILSAQCTDERVNKVTPALFRRYPSAQAFADAVITDLEQLIRSTGFFRNKAKNIQAACRRIISEHEGNVPRTLDELTALPGVARKTANVVLGNAFSTPGITVDTHVGRLSRRMGLTRQTDPVKVERDLNQLIDEKNWTDFSHRMIFHGRRICVARQPRCEECSIQPVCPQVGVPAHKKATSRSAP